MSKQNYLPESNIILALRSGKCFNMIITFAVSIMAIW